jgi:hypothetical protein
MRVPALPMLLGLLASSSGVRGAPAALPCPASDRPVILLTTEVKPPDQVIADALESHLAAELDARGIDLCVGSAAPRRPIGRVLLRVERPAEGPISALIRIGDEVTDKRVERSMDLMAMPADSRPLAVAAAADELLRASWAELQMRDAPAPAMAPPPAVLGAVSASMRPTPAPPRFELGAVGSSSYFQKRTGLGGAVLLGHELGARWSAVYRVGMERGLSTASTHGKTHADTTSVAAGIELAPWTGAIGLRLCGDVRFSSVRYVVDVGTSGNGHDAGDWAAVSGWGGRLSLDTGSARLFLGAAGLYAVRPSSATDEGQTIVRVGRVGGEVTLVVSLRL